MSDGSAPSSAGGEEGDLRSGRETVATAAGDVAFAPALSVFESQNAQNPSYNGDAVAPDTILTGLVDFGGAALDPGAYNSAIVYSTMLADVEGVIEIDSIKLTPAAA